MKRRAHRYLTGCIQRNAVCLAGLAVFVVCGLTVWSMSDIPFGPTFNGFVYAGIAGLVAALAAAGIRLLSLSAAEKIAGSVLLVAAVVVASVAGILLVDSTILLRRELPRRLTADEWLEDLDYLARVLPERHPAWFDMVAPAVFQERVDEVRRRIPELDDNAIRAEFAGVVALAGDAHSFPNIYSLGLDWHIFPLQLYDFDDGMFVVDAGREYRNLIGRRLVAIGGRDLADVSAAVHRYLATENEHAWRERFAQVGLLAEWLLAAGVIDDRRRGDFTFAGPDGARATVELKSVHYLPSLYWSMMRPVDGASPPPVPNDREDCYRFDYVAATRTLHIRFNHSREPEGGERMTGFIERLGAWVDANEFDRCVVDIRTNDGGDSRLGVQLASFLEGNEKINGRGKLFSVIGRKTFSAAVLFAARLENTTDVVFVGESTGQGPIFYGNPDVVELPRSGLEFLIASRLAQADLRCKDREAIVPDVPTRYTYDDYASGRDPAMEAILSYDAPSRLPARSGGDWTGRYRFSPCQALIVDENGGDLRFTLTDFLESSPVELSSRLYRVSGDRFATDIDGVELSFARGADGEVTSAEFDCGGERTTAERVDPGHRLALEMLHDGDIDAGAEAILADPETHRACLPGLEAVLNGLGYQFLLDERLAEAIGVFELNTRLFPESYNTYDSLGEGHMMNGDTGLAIENYEKSLELNPDNRNGREKLKRLRESSS